MLTINLERCTGCELCAASCPYDGITIIETKAHFNENCISCGICLSACPFNAITSSEAIDKKDLKIGWDGGIWVIAESSQNQLQPVTLELISIARTLADQLNVPTSVVLMGRDTQHALAQLKSSPADHIFLLEDARIRDGSILQQSAVLAPVITEYRPEIILIGATPDGRSLAPRLAARLQTGLTADCTELTIDSDRRLLIQTRPAFGGNLMAEIVCPYHRPQMATVRPGVFSIEDFAVIKEPEVHTLKRQIPEIPALELLEQRYTSNDDIDLTASQVIIGVGRGIGSVENLQLVERLAELIHAQIACTRPLVEAGWLDYKHQVGQTGCTVSPQLYLACGISGAVQHLAGISSAETVIAINNDPSAPIFNRADYSLIGDVTEILQELIAQYAL